MKRIPYFEPMFIKQYTADEMAEHMFRHPLMALANQQLVTRYFAEMPDNTPTEQELAWGIKEIIPESSYWFHFKNKLGDVLDALLDDPQSNRAVISIDFPEAPPCFQSFQWKVNKNHGIDLICYARSLDLDNGLPVDAPIFWKAGLEPIAKMMKANITHSTITIMSAGAHVYR